MALPFNTSAQVENFIQFARSENTAKIGEPRTELSSAEIVSSDLARLEEQRDEQMLRRNAKNQTSVAQQDEQNPAESYSMDPKLEAAKHSESNAEDALKPESPEEDEQTEDDEWTEERCAFLL